MKIRYNTFSEAGTRPYNNGKGWTTDQRSLCNACRNAILTALTTNNIEHSHN